MTEAVIKEDETQIQQASLIGTTLKLLAILIVPGLAMLLFSAIYFASQHVSEGHSAAQAFDAWMDTAPVMLCMMLGSSLITLPLLVALTPGKGWRDAFNYYRVTPTAHKKVYTTLAITALLFIFQMTLDVLFEIPEEPFVLLMKEGVTTLGEMLLLVSAICVIGPILEEFVFRGWLFGKLEQMRIGQKHGALIITTIIFTLMHWQYEHWSTYLGVALMGLFFGILRQRFQSCSYAIIAHMFANSVFTVFLFVS